MNDDLLWDYARLPFVGVLLQYLNEDGKALGCASGFIRLEAGSNFLYTCWHVVTGFDLNDIKVPPVKAPDRCRLRVSLQDSVTQLGVTTIGGLQTLELPLYEKVGATLCPL